MKLEMLTVGPFAENCYLYWDEKSNKGVIFDPGAESDKIVAAIEKAGFEPVAILLTHGHADHIGAVNEIKDRWKIPIYIGKGEEEYLSDPNLNGSAFYDHPITCHKPDYLVEDEKLYSFDSISLKVLFTPGHTSAGICYLDEDQNLLFCGDTLFKQSVGRTDLAGGDFDKLLDSINKKILSLPDDIICLPGHGPGTTVGAERVGNPFITGPNRYA